MTSITGHDNAVKRIRVETPLLILQGIWLSAFPTRPRGSIANPATQPPTQSAFPP